MAIGDDFNGPGRSEPAPARHHEPFQKTFFFEKGSWCRRAAAGRAAGGAARGPMRNTSPDRAPRTSHKLVGSWGAPGPPIGATHPQPAMAAGVARATGGSSAVRTPTRSHVERPALRTRRVAMPIGKVRPGHREAARGGCKRALERTVLLKGGLQPPHSADASTTAGRDRIDVLGRRLRQAGDVGWIANEADPGGGGRRGAASLAAGDDPRGQGGHRETARGLQTSPRKNVLYKGGLQPPPGDPGLKAVLERTGSPIPCDEGEDLLKGGRSRGISGESGGLALHPRAFSGKESSHPPSGPRPGLVPGCRRGRARRTRSRHSTPCRSVPTTMAKKAAPKAAQGKAAPAPAAKAAQGKAATAPATKAARARPPRGKATPAPATKAPPKATDTPAPARPKPANRTVVYTALAETTGLGKKEVAAVFSALGGADRQGAGQAGPWSVRRPRPPEAQGGTQARHQGGAGEEPVHRRADDDPGQARPQRRPGAAAEGPQGDGLIRDAGGRPGGHRGPRQKVASRLGGTADKVSKEGRPSGARQASPSPPTGPWSTPLWPRRPAWTGSRSPVFTRAARADRPGAGQEGPRPVRRPRTAQAQGGAQPATKARQGKNPFTGEPMTFKARRAQRRHAVPMKALEMV